MTDILLSIDKANLLLVAQYLDGESLSSLLSTNSSIEKCLREMEVWQSMCELHGFKSLGTTRTRGRRSFRDIYRDHVCVECRVHRAYKGIAIFDLDGGCLIKRSKSGRSNSGLIGVNGSKVALCSECLNTVTTFGTTWNARKCLLPRLKYRDRHYSTIWNALMNKIPFGTIPKRRTISRTARAEGEVEGAQFNDYLINSVLPPSNRVKKARNSARR